jgi:hypothetical protein
MPGGGTPVALQIKGSCPPLANRNAKRYGSPTAPAEGVGVVMSVGGWGVTTTVYGGINDDAATAIGTKLTNVKVPGVVTRHGCSGSSSDRHSH